MFLSSATACGLSGFITSATAIMPSRLSLRQKNSGVLPSAASSPALASSDAGISMRSFTALRLPPSASAPSISARTPLPGRALKPSIAPGSIPRLCAPLSTAFARGCSLRLSRVEAKRRSSSSLTPSAGITSVISGVPAVMVPVLSSTTVSTLPAASIETAVLNSIPCFAPMPLPTIIATGVASPRAQGQLITSTDIPRATLLPSSSHTMNVTAAMDMTVGTNTPETLSAIFAIGALVAEASLTILMIWLRVVSSPTRSARQRI